MTANKVVLVIDDVQSVLQFIRGALIGYSVDIVTALDGESGLELARELVPDLVLLDLALPGLTGWEVMEALSADDDTSHVPIVIVTAHGESGAASRARDMGAKGFIAKPFRPSELRRVIAEHVGEPVSSPS